MDSQGGKLPFQDAPIFCPRLMISISSRGFWGRTPKTRVQEEVSDFLTGIRFPLEFKA
jgi:hypothetical protein